MPRPVLDEWEDEESLDLTDRENWLDEQARDLTANENWPVEKLQYKGLSAGQVSGVATQTTGDVVIFHRADRIWEAK